MASHNIPIDVRKTLLEHFPEDLVVILSHRVKLANCNANLRSLSPGASPDQQCIALTLEGVVGENANNGVNAL
jgi:hypothetical protein